MCYIYAALKRALRHTETHAYRKRVLENKGAAIKRPVSIPLQDDIIPWVLFTNIGLIYHLIIFKVMT